MHKILTYSIIVQALIFNGLYAQDYTIRDIVINTNGESHKDINIIQVDHEGFLWYSTYNGIVKDFETHSVLSTFVDEDGGNPPKIGFTIFIDNQHRIWVSTQTGIFVSNESLDDSFNRIKFKPFLRGENLSGNSYIEDCDGNIWIVGADNIILKVDSTFAVEKYQIEALKPTYALSDYYKREFLFFEKIIDCDKILCRQGRKLFILEKGEVRLIADYTSTKNYEMMGYFHPEWTFNGGDGILITSNGELLPKSKEIQYTYEGKVFESLFIEDLDIQVTNLPFQEMIPITENGNPILKDYADLIGIDGLGKNVSLYKMMETNGNFQLRKTYEIPFPFWVEDLVIDKNDVIHVSNYDRISKIKFSASNFDKVLNHYEKQDMNTYGFLELPNEEILAATNSGIFKLSPNDGADYGESPYETENIFPSLNFLKAFAKTSDSRMWCLGRSKGLWEIDFLKNTIEEIHIFNSHWRLANLHYNDILKHSDSTLLLASSFGLQEFNYKQKKFRELPILPVENNRELFIQDLHRTKDKLYIGTNANGLFIQDLNSGGFLHLGTKTTHNGWTLPTNKIHAIFLDRYENIWLGTDKGAVQIDKDLNKTEVIDTSDGLTDLNVVGILEDADGNIWFSTYDGLYRYEKNSKKVTAFYAEDGLPFNDFNQYSHYRTSSNTLLFGGLRGLIAFDSIDDAVRFQDIRIFPTKFEYYDSDREKDVELDALDTGSYGFDLPYSKNSFSITYSINDCYNTDTNKYAYKLEGFTEDWVNLGSQTTLKLLSIPPGDYVLRIKGSDPAGVESANELNYDIHVAQVFYKRPWIQAVALLFLLGIVALVLYGHSKRERKKHQLRLTLVELERKTLRAQMNPHFIFNALNGIRKTVKEGTLSKLDDYITNFSSLMRLTLDLTRNENILLSKEIRYIQNYVALTNTKSEHKIDLIIQCGPDIDMEDTFIPSMILQPIVENSIVHGFTEGQREKSITLKIERSTTTEQLVITIEDNGIGISGAKRKAVPDKEHQSYATQILHERLKLLNQIRRKDHGFEIAIKDVTDVTRTGAVVTIKIPYENW
ncbi:sensor histidine kinase [Ulvibacterium marinum]|uniref:sensor histidine kinase n=1 Tax=Ulvibacterium marinum TaxID=2419782 RepID=UPI002495046D|nr:sensor histidine kinase [Ulvibacterium marinum]